MAGTIAHLVIASKILDKLDSENIKDVLAFLIGSIIPDSIESKENATREDKMHTHLRYGINYLNWLETENQELFHQRIKKFIMNNIQNESVINKDIYIGYVVHLLTDEYYHKIIRQELLRKVDEKDRNKEILPMMTNELYAIDYYLLTKHTNIKELLIDMANSNRKFEVKNYISHHLIQKSFSWIINEYLINIKHKKPLYISYQIMDKFVDDTVDIILSQLSTGILYPVLFNEVR